MRKARGVGAIEAGRRALSRLDILRRQEKDFVFETTLSSNHSLALMAQARQAGYVVDLTFVILSSVELHLLRVAGRVRMGGHDIPSADVRRRYLKSICNLARALPLADTCTVLDNSQADIRVLLRVRGGVVEASALDRAQAHHASIVDAVAEALALQADDVFKGGGFNRKP